MDNFCLRSSIADHKQAREHNGFTLENQLNIKNWYTLGTKKTAIDKKDYYEAQ